LVHEAIEISRNAPRQQWQEARGKILIAQCEMASGNLEEAEAELAAAWSTLQPYETSMILAGPVGTLRGWWRVNARLQQEKGDLPGALAAIGEAVAYARRIALMPQFGEAPAFVKTVADLLTQKSTILAAMGDLPAAEEASAEARFLRGSVHLPPV